AHRGAQSRMSLSVAALLLASRAFSQSSASRSFYDARCSFAGCTIPHGNSTAAYERNGRFDGTAIRNSYATTSFSDRNGHRRGTEGASCTMTGPPDPDEMAKQAREHAWNWFALHAAQRMQTFNFFIVATAFLIAAYASLLEKHPGAAAVLAAVGAWIAFWF